MQPSWKAWYRVDTVPTRWLPVYLPVSYALAALLWSYIRLVRRTCRFTVIGEEHLQTKRFVWVVWHEHVWLTWVSLGGDFRGQGWMNHPFWYMRPIHLAARWDGVETLYLGSSGTGGRAALEAMIAGVRHGQNTMIMPDGPSGPRRRVRPGAVLTAAATGVPLVPLRFEAKRCWNLGGWDEKQLPIPFVSRWELTVREPITVTRGEEEAATFALAKALNG
jgi:lysophospholipid acyltransferase (LPLAT)-like uncharacterized protein